MTDPLIGAQLGNFKVLRVLGRGGMATVYYGMDVRLERPVAIKVIDARYRDDPAYTRRFLNEARAVAAFRHENILQVHYADVEDGLYYFVMEYVRGPDLAQLLDEYARSGELMPVADVVRVARAMAAALDYAHDRSVIHRDVKPANVLVAEDGRVVLTDFGLAMNVDLGTSGEVFGSPHYMSPEQVRSSAEAVPGSDLYALGVVLYEMLTGAVPFDDENAVALATMHVNEPPPPPSETNPGLGGEIDAVLVRALAKSPKDRYPSGRELVEALETALGDVEPAQAAGLAKAAGLTKAAGFAEAAPAAAAGSQKPALTLPELPEQERKPAESKPRRVSRTTLAELTAQYVSENYPDEPGAPPLSAGMAPRPPRAGVLPARAVRRYAPWLLGGGGCLLLSVLFMIALMLASAANPPGREPTERSQQPEDTAEAAAEATDPPTPSSPTLEGPPPTPLQEGDYHEAYYDDTSFYLKNLSGVDRPIGPIAFERLHNNGAILDRWEGWRWSEIYPKHPDGLCVVIEIVDFVDHLDPQECKNKYVIVRTPTLAEGEDTIFWTQEGGSKVFRVLWNDVEVARCVIKDGLCEIYLPPVGG